MSALWWIVLAAVLVACPIAAAIYLQRARESGQADELREAFADLERELGAALRPIVKRVVPELEKWQRRR